jgi:hypothetical protein
LLLMSHRRLSPPPLNFRWYRDPTLPVPRTDITRFPHAVLEVKLSLRQGEEAPEWIKASVIGASILRRAPCLRRWRLIGSIAEHGNADHLLT